MPLWNKGGGFNRFKTFKTQLFFNCNPIGESYIIFTLIIASAFLSNAIQSWLKYRKSTFSPSL